MTKSFLSRIYYERKVHRRTFCLDRFNISTDEAIDMEAHRDTLCEKIWKARTFSIIAEDDNTKKIKKQLRFIRRKRLHLRRLTNSIKEGEATSVWSSGTEECFVQGGLRTLATFDNSNTLEVRLPPEGCSDSSDSSCENSFLSTFDCVNEDLYSSDSSSDSSDSSLNFFCENIYEEPIEPFKIPELDIFSSSIEPPTPPKRKSSILKKKTMKKRISKLFSRFHLKSCNSVGSSKM
ncbi:unnamed protein product [Dimorphilus gyrociliatus]|uniref:Uncharacterized protein n=1 Tax=Dimorphilus gyrociliatus TaxID=2664684 RepID=A0A7I8VFE6_9ANNE|nr:unnamed protein product [Dimorphilus gyrociliatus]